MSSQTLSHCSASAFSQWLALPPGVPESWGWFWCILQDPMKLRELSCASKLCASKE